MWIPGTEIKFENSQCIRSADPCRSGRKRRHAISEVEKGRGQWFVTENQAGSAVSLENNLVKERLWTIHFKCILKKEIEECGHHIANMPLKLILLHYCFPFLILYCDWLTYGHQI